MDKEKEHMSRLKDAVEMKVDASRLSRFHMFHWEPDDEFLRSAGILMVLFMCPTSQPQIRSLFMSAVVNSSSDESGSPAKA